LEMDWAQYSIAFIVFGLVGALVLYAILRLQQFLPFFYARYQTTPLNPDVAMNTAISFATTTTWQAYGGEATMSYTSQMVGLTVQNFLAGASGWRLAWRSSAGSRATRHIHPEVSQLG
jgi:K+-transporting ATPase ATPase A chain